MKERRVWRPPDPTWRNTPANIVFGIKGGLSIAILCTAIATIALVLSMSDPFKGYRTTFVKGIAAYFTGGIVAGAVGGALRPLTRRSIGKLFVGGLVGVMADVVLRIAQDGFHFWGPNDLAFAVMFAMFGIITAFLPRNAFRSRIRKNKDDVPPAGDA
jgi:peptidoglycan/LPS O-acetylase OafA/YrhL